MPAATIGLFALAIVLIAVAFLINQAVDDDGNGGTNEADAFATQNAAAQLTAQAGTQTPQGEETPDGEETPSGEETPGDGTPATTPTGTAGEGDEYTVQADDTCFGIAEDHEITLAELLEANDMTEEDCQNLQEGQTLTIP
jgi:hypothetical protein